MTKQVLIASLLLYTKDGKVLLQHRSDDARFLPGYWGAFGGHVEPGESVEAALKRELLEELEYRVRGPRPLNVKERETEEGVKIVTHNFIEEYDAAQLLVQHEGQGYGWFTIPEAVELKMTDSRKEDLLLLQSKLFTRRSF